MGVPYIFRELTLHLMMVGTRFHHSTSSLLINHCLCCKEAFSHPICPGFSSYPCFWCRVTARPVSGTFSVSSSRKFAILVLSSVFQSFWVSFMCGCRREKQFYFNCSIYVTSLRRYHTVNILSVSVRNSEIKSWGTSNFGRVASRYPWRVHRDFKMGWIQK